MKVLRYAFLLLCLAAFPALAGTAKPVHHASKAKVTLTHAKAKAVKSPAKKAVVAKRVARPPGPSGLTLTSPAEQCMAVAMYREARGEGDKGMAGVGYLIKNRTEHRDFPNTICGVVLQRKPGCQFTCGWSTAAINQAEFAHVKELAAQIILGAAPNPVGKSIFFNEKSRGKPSKWAVASVRLGRHQFYLDRKSPLPVVRSADHALLAER